MIYKENRKPRPMALVGDTDLGDRKVLADAGRVAIWGIIPQTLK